MNWLSKNITYSELIHSNTAARHKIDNTPPREVEDNLVKLALALQVIRSHFRRPVIVSSGYRSEALNKLVNGSEHSHHIKGLAADFTVQGVPNEEVIRVIPKLIVFDQMINEYNSWVHLSIHPRLRKQVFNINE